MVVKKSIRTEHERKERERENERQKKSCGFRGCIACTAKVCWHRHSLRCKLKANKLGLKARWAEKLKANSPSSISSALW